MSEPLLVHVPYSPWSQRARLALALGGVVHRRKAYLAMLGEPWLRWKTGRWSGRVSVPVLLTDQGAVADSLAIARLALAGTELWPEDQAIEAWNGWSERMLTLGRLRTTRRVLGDAAALRASLPPGLRGFGPLSTLLARTAAAWLLRKYGLDQDDAQVERQLDAMLDQLDGVLGDQPYLLGALSYADITAAVGLAFVSPPPQLEVAEAARPHWTIPALAERHARLLAWRDGVLAECRDRAVPA